MSGTSAADPVSKIRNLGSENVRYTDVLKAKGTDMSNNRLSQKESVRIIVPGVEFWLSVDMTFLQSGYGEVDLPVGKVEMKEAGTVVKEQLQLLSGKCQVFVNAMNDVTYGEKSRNGVVGNLDSELLFKTKSDVERIQ